MAKMKNWFGGFNKKQKIVFGVAAVLVVILIGALSWMATTGRLGINAAGSAISIQDMSADDVLLCHGTDYTDCEYAQDQGVRTASDLRSIAVGENVGNFIACANDNYTYCAPVPPGYRDNDLKDAWNVVDPALHYTQDEITIVKSYAKLDRGRLVGDTLAQNANNTSCTPGDNQVAFYGDSGYGATYCAVANVSWFETVQRFGWAPSGNMRPGTAYARDGYFINDDQISSIKVGKNVQVTVFKDSNYQGDSIYFTDSVSNLDGLCWDRSTGCTKSNDVNDEISSVKVEAKSIDFTLNPPQQTLPPNTNFTGSTAYKARAVKPTTITGPITFKTITPKSYIGGTLATGVKLENDTLSASLRTADLAGTTGAAGQYGSVGVSLLDGTGAVVAQRYANLKVTTDAGICALTASPATLGLVQGETKSVTVGVASGTLPDFAIMSGVTYTSDGKIPDVEFFVDQSNTLWPTIKVTAPANMVVGSYVLKLKRVGNDCQELSIPITVSTGCSLTATPTDLNIQELSTGTITISANQAIAASDIAYQIYPDGEASTTLLSVDASAAPTFKITALNGTYGKSARILFFDLRQGTGATYCQYAFAHVTVGTPKDLEILPPTATIKTGESRELYVVNGLISDDAHQASTADTTVSQVVSFIVDANDATKGYITVSGLKVGTTTVTATSAGRSAQATINVEQGDNPTDCPDGKEYVNGECLDPFSIVSFTADPTKISLGDLSKLSWQTSGATSDARCDINHDVGGVNAVSGSTSVKPYSSSTYSLTCTDHGRVRVEKASVSVVGNICYSNQEAISVPQNMWHIKTLPTNAITSDWSLATYLGNGVLSYFFNNFGNPYGKGVDGKAENFIGQGFWLKNESGKDFICYYEGASTPNTTTVEKVLPFKALDMTGNPLGVQMNLADVKFKFSSTGDQVYTWNEAVDNGYVKAAFLWNHPTNSYLAYTNLSRYPEFDKYGYQSFTNMPKVIGAYEGMWIVPRTTETVTVIYGVE